MKIGVDITPLQLSSPGGIGTSVYEILRVLAGFDGVELSLYGTRPPVVPFSDTPLDLDLPLHLGEGPLARSNIAWLRWGVGPTLVRDGLDAFWGTRHVAPMRAGSVGLVTTAYDFWYAHHPEQQPFVNRTLNRLVTAGFMRDSHVVAAISDATARDARMLFPESADRVRTVLLGVDAEKFAPRSEAEVAAVLERLGITRPYVLAMDVYNPRKNALAILDAVAEVAPKVEPFEVCALGRPRGTALEVDLAAHATAVGIGDRLRLPGDVGFSDLIALYSGAAAFVYPSVYEGFGMPVLEAMAAGAPVICSDRSSMPQVAGDAAIEVDPTCASAIANALERVLGEPGVRDALVEAGRRRARELTWERTAEGLVAAFEDAAAAARGDAREDARAERG